MRGYCDSRLCNAATAILPETFEEGNEDKLLTRVEIMKEIMYGFDSVVKLTDEIEKKENVRGLFKMMSRRKPWNQLVKS